MHKRFHPGHRRSLPREPPSCSSRLASFFPFTQFKLPKMSRGSGGTRVYFGRLPRDTRERDLERFVRGFGRVREVSIKLGYGFVVSSQGITNLT